MTKITNHTKNAKIVRSFYTMFRRIGCKKTLIWPIRGLHASTVARADFSHVVLGGGVVGTAVAAELQAVDGNNVLLVEQNSLLGMETTSRNSEVIHAGIYYPKNSLKGQLCIKGKKKIYQAFEKGTFQVPLKMCGKWVVAQNNDEYKYLEKIADFAKDLEVPVNFVSTKEAKKRFPLIRAEAGVLESPTTGIISAHDYTLFFLTSFENAEGTLGLNTRLEDMSYNSLTPSYTLTLRENGSNSLFEVTSDNVVNSTGLHAQRVANMLLPKERHFQSHFAKGTYFSYTPLVPVATSAITDKLVYPCPNPNASSLGTHLTFDLGGQLRFGPDLEWLEDVHDARDIDYTATETNLVLAKDAIASYFPSVTADDLLPSYSGVRPKVFSREQNYKQFADFYIKEEDGFPGFVNLLGIESPGLTSAWAIGEYVRKIYHG